MGDTKFSCMEDCVQSKDVRHKVGFSVLCPAPCVLSRDEDVGRGGLIDSQPHN